MSFVKKTIILLGLLVIAVMILYPPYTIEYKVGGEIIERYVGFGSFFSPPNSTELYKIISPRPGPGVREGYEWYYYKIHIDYLRLVLQIFFVAVFVEGSFCLIKK